jgi:hypothetical protein
MNCLWNWNHAFETRVGFSTAVRVIEFFNNHACFRQSQLPVDLYSAVSATGLLTSFILFCILKIGDSVIAFPDRMSDAEVSAAARRLTQRVDAKVVLRLLKGGARLADDAQRVMDTMPAEQRAAFRDAVRSAIDDKAAGAATKARKIFSRSETPPATSSETSTLK